MDGFLRGYVEGLGVLLNNYIFSVMGVKYVKGRDVGRMVEWLEYCVGLGFEVDVVFSNVILMVLRREWKMLFRDLRMFYWKLRLLSLKFVDRYIEMVMVRVVLGDGSGGRVMRGRLLFLCVECNILLYKGKCVDVREFVLVMKEYLMYGYLRVVLRMYRVF